VSEIDELIQIEANGANLRRLVEQLQSDSGIIPFIGAGVSIPVGFPSWTAFLLSQAHRVGLKSKVQHRIKAGEYEEAAQDLLDCMQPRAFNDAIEDKFGDHLFQGKDLSGTASYIPLLTRGPIITTNFDRVLERVFENAGRPFERVILGARPDSFHKAVHQGRNYLLKIHGDFEDRADRVLTLEDYQRHYGIKVETQVDFSLPLPRILKQILWGRTLLFIGCSLSLDRTVSLLRSIVSETPEVAHFAIVEKPKVKAQYYLKTRQLAEQGIRPIWFPHGEYKFIEVVLAYLAEHVKRETKIEGGSTITPATDVPTVPQVKRPMRQLYFDHLIERHTQLFAGREGHLKSIADFLETNASGYIFVEALSGYGKTSLLAKLVLDNPQFAYHFISQAYKTRGSAFDPTEMDSLLLNLCEQLELADARHDPQTSAWSRFHTLLRSPPVNGPRVVVIDAVDEVSQHPNYLLGLFPLRLPPGVFVIISARKLGDHNYLSEVGLGPGNIGKTIQLEGLGEDSISRLLKLAGGKATALGESQSFVAKLHAVSQGDPFYLRFLVEDIKGERITTQSISRAPSGLNDYFDMQLSILDRSTNLPQQRDILGVILAAFGPLSRSDLINMVDGLDGLNFDNVLKDIRRFLLAHDDLYTFCHGRFKEYFSARCRIGAKDGNTG
jgi:hypothetical protein